jgi:hypothetical protein
MTHLSRAAAVALVSALATACAAEVDLDGEKEVEGESRCSDGVCDSAGDLAYVQGLLEKGMVDGVGKMTDANGNMKFDFMLSAYSYFDSRYFRNDSRSRILVAGVKASDALDHMFSEPSYYGFECATAISILHYSAVRDTLRTLTGSDDLFNTKFRDMRIGQLELGVERDMSTIRKTVSGVKRTGDHGYFSNPDVTPEARAGGWNGENVVVMPDGRYFGHPFGITTAADIITNLNSVRRTDLQAPRSAYLTESQYRLSAEWLVKLLPEGSVVPPPAPAATTFSKTQAVGTTIPDNTTAGISNSINATISGTVSSITVTLNITHTYVGDLVVRLQHGSRTVDLHRRSGGSSDNLRLTVPSNLVGGFVGAVAGGEWKLLVSDNAGGDIGKLQSWSLSVNAQ